MATTKIILQELRLSCLIGVDAAERHIRQTLLLDIDMCIETPPKDDETPVVDYHEAVKELRAFAELAECGLMETFAEQAADRLLGCAGVQSVRVYCRKPKPFADIAAAGVEIHRP